MACPVEKHTSTSTVEAQAIGRVVSWNNPGFCNKGSQVIFAFVHLLMLDDYDPDPVWNLVEWIASRCPLHAPRVPVPNGNRSWY